ncbi:7,8-dihydro-8-oxoguanine triphosphatase [Hondaea fermentalgiana]|uniref:Oxidized purine nucleoside triphosphate hydrolase n=1 Tax=Hondaea fermentalgiana TaxID=2315210 RepID=A0A2R5GYT8_9STRA|nr:7,8-dihydro-8-oxoguanine triphosphatase [Hondaea fermentalgiana]|eukprot:GBG33164.1 7,8-dihydro-8-oxoguanine triphosphatase [Hondaea fermentalgiana]
MAAQAGARPRKELTNAFVVAGGRVLLGMKKRGFGEGKWNGFGGKLQQGETALEAAQRELLEEASVQMLDPQLVGRVTYTYEDMQEELLVHVFRATRWTPEEPRESEEMKPCWFALEDIPFANMWADDEHWYEHMLGGSSFFTANFAFAKDHKTILQHDVKLDPLSKTSQ